ncbi:MAG: hypothetical protein GXP48_07010 [Acidobacteria bacterium]|nr:hypothetical protein [Acidobacteriota bacterium]
MKTRKLSWASLFVGLVLLLTLAGETAGPSTESPWTRDGDGWLSSFRLRPGELSTVGRNLYWILEPGHRIVLEGKSARVAITVLDETETVGPFLTRVVEEREWYDGELMEVSRIFFAMSRSTRNLYYFGEDVDILKRGKIVGHDGSWRAFEGESRPGLMMPGTPRAGMRYYQEHAPGVAMDRAEIMTLDRTMNTADGTRLEHCLEVEETSALDVNERSTKVYAPGIGPVLDDEVSIVSHGFVTTAEDDSEAGSRDQSSR